MCRTGHEHAANDNTHKPHVHTKHDNMKACSQWNTQAACHTAQYITWMHAADKNTNYVQQHKTRGQESAQPSEFERECLKPDTKPKLKTWVPGSEHHAPTRNKACRWESAWLERTGSRTLTWKQDKSVRTLTNWVYSMHYFKWTLFYLVINIELFYCLPSFMPIHISKYRINNVIKYIPNIVIWESILYNTCITNQYFTLDPYKIKIFLVALLRRVKTFWGITAITTAYSLGLTSILNLLKNSLYVNKTPSLFKSWQTTIILFSNQ